ncbi:ABC transporter ATP-binding protein [Desulfoplanes formicivorans]|uniref:ABC transporter n=1 Tax=Desulfoplanes formicivorans TaxID=1592317 RepID=A0A194AL42_9BACT|nr:ABC transporter ATP-binding protein [Desulfoplanes formicivorans]GAU09761.1 ABC transporter [Desulfoplanes formicivorans]
MDLQLRGISKQYNGKPVLQDVSFDVAKGEFVALVGPSGAGKTTLLKVIAGLEDPDGGEIHCSFASSKERPIILVFQDFLLFPTMTVFENIAFGLRARKFPKTVIRERVEHMLHYFQLENRANAYPAQLSGGQQQRVAIARGMVVNPAVMLLDEPFANLDRSLRLETAGFIRRTQQEFGITTIAVTHDLDEALAVSDSMGVLMKGRLEQMGTPKEVYFFPKNQQVARFLGPMNTIPADMFHLLDMDVAPGTRELLVRPEALDLAADPDGPGTIREVRFSGHYQACVVAVGGRELVIYQKPNGLRTGHRVRIRVNADLGTRE